MLLRRITKHVKDQNWFAVALDFFIVVAGILIAFQITNWSAARQDNLLYEQARTRVIEEAKVNLNLAESFILRSRNYTQTARDIIQDLETCNPEAGAEDRLMRAIQPIRFMLATDVRNDAITLMLRSDAFLDNISPQDRTMLSTYAQKVDSFSENQQFSAEFSLTRIMFQDIAIFSRKLDRIWSDGLVGGVLTASYADACKDTTLNAFLFDRLEHGTYHSMQAERLAEASYEVLTGLGENLPENTTLDALQ